MVYCCTLSSSVLFAVVDTLVRSQQTDAATQTDVVLKHQFSAFKVQNAKNSLCTASSEWISHLCTVCTVSWAWQRVKTHFKSRRHGYSHTSGLWWWLQGIMFTCSSPCRFPGTAASCFRFSLKTNMLINYHHILVISVYSVIFYWNNFSAIHQYDVSLESCCRTEKKKRALWTAWISPSESTAALSPYGRCCYNA